MRTLLIALSLILLLSKTGSEAMAQEPVAISDEINQHIFSYGELESFEDTSGEVSFQQILTSEIQKKFRKNLSYTPKTTNFNSTYWYKLSIRHNSRTNKNWLLECFDQTIDYLTIYTPLQSGMYAVLKMGDAYTFRNRGYPHKNFAVDIKNKTDSVKTYYFEVKSSQSASMIIVLRDVHWFVQYALDEYLVFGLFYGMIVVFSLYNLLMYFAVRQRQYLYYILYNLSIGFYEMCVDGIAFQYFWPDLPSINTYSIGFALYSSSFFGLLFTVSFLHVRTKSVFLYRIIIAVMVLRTLFFVYSVFNPLLFYYRIIEIIPLLVAFSTGIIILKKGYRPARFFVIGYGFLFIGFLIKILVYLQVSWLHTGPITHYSLSFTFLVEMVFVSIAIGDNIRHLRKKKDHVQRRMIKQLQENEKLKDTLNRELTVLVDERTKEVVEKAEIISRQAEEISRMNALLKKDNQELQVNIEKVTRARVMSQDVDFSEFSKIYPDRESCFKYLSGLKWDKGYACKKCNSENYMNGKLPYSRRCTKCRYEESVINNTIFQNSRIPINKAFYMLYLVYNTKGKISSHKLSEILSIRQSTCWAYSSKMKAIMDERKKELKKSGTEGWSKLVLEN